MTTQSIWNSFSNPISYPALNGNITVDTAIIGGGITGLATAMKLAQAGQRVVVLEALKIGGGSTSHSTGNLYSTVDTKLQDLESKYGKDVVKQIVQARQKAVEQIAGYVAQYNIDCDFHRQDFYMYGTEENRDLVEKEAKTAEDLGMQISFTSVAELPISNVFGFKLHHQAQFNPMRFIQGFSVEVAKHCQVFENTKVEDINESDGKYELATARGIVTAKHVVHATHTPKGIKLWHTLLGPYREYGIACRVRNLQHPEGIFWGFHGEKRDKFSTRTYTR
ncbi:hypothetical protein BH09BAC1_BH09BAC1_17040 [soil metagenome]